MRLARALGFAVPCVGAACFAVTIVMTVRHIVYRFQEVHVSGTAVTPEPEQPGHGPSAEQPAHTSSAPGTQMSTAQPEDAVGHGDTVQPQEAGQAGRSGEL